MGNLELSCMQMIFTSIHLRTSPAHLLNHTKSFCLHTGYTINWRKRFFFIFRVIMLFKTSFKTKH